MYKNIGFIGAGNMGSAIANCIDALGFKGNILIADSNVSQAEKIAGSLCNGRVSTNDEVAMTCDLIFFAVKPQHLALMVEGIRETLKNRTDRVVICSMAAGTSIEKIKDMLKVNLPIIRIMPNTPVGIGKGVVVYASEGTSDDDIKDFEDIMKGAGIVDPIAENLIDAASSVSGCGPAFVYMFIEALADGAVSAGLPRAKALKYAAKMVEGSAALVLESGKHPGELKDAVCSPGGTTIQGVRQLEDRGMRGAVIEAVIAAYEKNKHIG